MIITKRYNKKIIKILRQGGVGVIPTDTIYGVVGSALKKNVVERIYALRKRNPKKPMIVLIASIADLKKFGVTLSVPQRKILKKVWPGRVSVILPCPSKKFRYLHRGKKAIAFRLPAKKALQQLLKRVGPLVAPSANIEGAMPAETIGKAEKYFGNLVDFYVDGGRVSSKPSMLVKMTRNAELEIIRK